MNEHASALDVFFHGRLAGQLELDERRRFVFQYSSGWIESPHAVPLSLSLPLRRGSYCDDAARPFFANLLPEGEIRKLVARKLGLSEQNDYALLEKIGGECAGAVSILPRGSRPVEDSSYRALDGDELHKVLAELPRRPLLAGEKGIRLSLAGAQNKLPVYMEGEKIFLPTGNSPSTHILKPPIPGLEETVENEAFCMTLAAKVGLPVAAVAIRKNRDTFLIVERYDRRGEKNGTVVRLHQEDFCQALGILPEQKYESEGGPSLQSCFTLLKRHSTRPAADQKFLLGWVIFNVLVGNADAHAKNLSILFTEKGPQLAPFYDLLSTLIYPDLTEKFAMKIGGENRPSWIRMRHWERLADDVFLKRNFVLSVVKGMANSLIAAIGDADAAVQQNRKSGARVARIAALIRKRTAEYLGA